MKFVQILLFVVVVAVLTDAALSSRITRATVAEGVASGADASGYGEDLAAKTAVIEQQDEDGIHKIASSAASTKEGAVSSSSGMAHVLAWKFDGEPEKTA